MNVSYGNAHVFDELTYPEVPVVDMLRTLVMLGVIREVVSAAVVAVENRRRVSLFLEIVLPRKVSRYSESPFKPPTLP